MNIICLVLALAIAAPDLAAGHAPIDCAKACACGGTPDPAHADSCICNGKQDVAGHCLAKASANKKKKTAARRK